MTRRLLAVCAAVLGLLVFTSTAGAKTLGVTAPPSGSTPIGCGAGEVIGQEADDPTTPYLVPSPGGEITQWQTYAAGDTAGTVVTLAVLQPTGGGNYTVVAVDAEKLPTPLPSDNVASFTLANPIPVAAGDTFALYASASYVCYFDGGTTPSGDVLFASSPTLPLAAGATVTAVASSPAQYVLNAAVTLVQNEDASVQGSTFPSTIDAAGAALLQSVVTNGGPGAGPITFVDQVPSGLRIQSATAGAGSCTVSGQTVTCTISGLASGQSTNVNVLVTPSATGSYTNAVSVSIASGLTDPNSSNNNASVNLVVTPLPHECIVPGSLRKVPQAAASTLLTELGCAVHVERQHSGITKGLVLGVQGGARAYPYHQIVTLDVSSGPKKKTKKHKRR